MPLDAQLLINLIRLLTSVDSIDRERGCGTVTDWIHSFGESEVRLLASLLCYAALAEDALDVRESQLHAIVELGDSGFLDAKSLSPLQRFDRASLRGSEIEYFDYFDEISGK